MRPKGYNSTTYYQGWMGETMRQPAMALGLWTGESGRQEINEKGLTTIRRNQRIKGKRSKDRTVPHEQSERVREKDSERPVNIHICFPVTPVPGPGPGPGSVRPQVPRPPFLHSKFP